jgi:iron complex outermembrane recepter protein
MRGPRLLCIRSETEVNNDRIHIGAALLGLALAPAAGAQEQPGDELLPEIIVTADPRGRAVDDLIQPVNVMTGSELERRRAGTLGEVLDGVPGAANSDFGPGVGRPVIRGMQGSRVRILEDGLGTADVAGEGADHAIAIDPDHAEQIEVFRGPTTLLYGSRAAGGVVNVRTRRFSPQFEPGIRADLGLSYGWNGSDRQSRVLVEGQAAENWVLRGDYSLRRTSDFDINGFQQIDQTAGNHNRLRISSVETDSGSLTGLVSADWGYLGVGLSRWKTDYGIPENFDARPRDQGGQEDEYERIEADYDRFDLRGEFQNPFRGMSSARLKIAYTEFEQQEIEFEYERTPEGGVLDERVVEAAFENDELEARLELVHEPLGLWQGVIGLQYSDRDFFAYDPEADEVSFYVRPNVTSTLALFAIEELPTGFGKIELGARVERERSSAADLVGVEIEGVTLPNGAFLPLPETLDRRRFTPLSLSAGAIVDLGEEHHLRLSLTRSERAPSAEQLYAFGRHPAAGTFEVGDASLGKERYLNFEVGIDRHHGPLRLDASVFYNRADDFIYLMSEDDGSGTPVFVNDIGNRAGEGAAAGCAPGEGGLCRLRNQLVFNTQQDAEFRGAEFRMVTGLPTGAVQSSLRFSGDYVRGRLRGDSNLPRITPMRLGLGFDTRYRELDFSVDYRRVFRQSSTAVAEEATSGFHLLSADVVWRPAARPGWSVFLKGRNLLDEDGRLHQSFFRNEAPIIGRAVSAGFRMQFGD